MTILNKKNINKDEDYIFTDSDLVELLSFLNQFYEITSLNIKKDSDLEQVIYDFNEVGTIDNYKNRKIVSISTIAYLREKGVRYKGSPALYLKIQNSRSNYEMSLNISYDWYDEADGLKIDDFLTKFLAKKKRNFTYSFFNKYTKGIDFLLMFLSGVWITFLLTSIESIKKQSNTSYIFVISIFIFLVTIISFFRSRIIRAFTPKIVFMFGDEITEEYKREKLRTNIFWSLFMGGFVIPFLWIVIPILTR